MSDPHGSPDSGGRFGRAFVTDGRVYDLVQRVIGGGETSRRLQRELAGLGSATVLDIGAGTGNRVPQLPPSTRYVWLDIDGAKLKRFRHKWPQHRALLSDANHVAIADGSSDCTLCVAVTHHLPPAALSNLFRELARVTRGVLVFVDAVRMPGAPLSRVLWRLDRGAHPHSEQELLQAMSASFHVEHVERYARYHHYLMCRARPLAAARGTAAG
jgi:SAM-dependent methyltransferase